MITIVQIIVDDTVGFYSNTKNVKWKKRCKIIQYCNKFNFFLVTEQVQRTVSKHLIFLCNFTQKKVSNICMIFMLFRIDYEHELWKTYRKMEAYMISKKSVFCHQIEIKALSNIFSEETSSNICWWEINDFIVSKLCNNPIKSCRMSPGSFDR